MNILIIGAGNMGKTYASGFLSNHLILPKHLSILTRRPLENGFFKTIPEENILLHPDDQIGMADIVILAVKPQDFPTLCNQIKPFIRNEQIILSVMAGITVSSIIQQLKVSKVVRCMPNLPAQVGMGMTVFTCSQALEKKELFIVQNLLNATGKSIYVENEKMIDAATAISGSGPAYVYFFMEAIIQSAIQIGFSRSEAELIVNQTFMGAVMLHNRNELTCSEWIKKVASKGGTTEAAMNVFNEHELNHTIGAGLSAAYNRAIELGKTNE